MRRKTAGLLMAVSCGALLAGGCAKHEVVKTDEPLAPSAAVAAATTAPPRQGEAETAARRSPLAQEVIKEFAVAKDAATGTSQAGELNRELEGIYFNFDSANLSEQARDRLVKVADLMTKTGSARIRVEGNCDEKGSDDYNLALGEKRARAAVGYLINLGIPAGRLTAISYGKEKPAETGHDEASLAKNRRDDFVVVP